MHRMKEELISQIALEPRSVEASTPTTSDYMDAAGASEVLFLLAVGKLEESKGVTVELLGSSDSSGSDATVFETQAFVWAETCAGVLSVSYRPAAAHGRYVAMRFQHDADSAVNCAVTVLLRQKERPTRADCTVFV